MLQQVANTTDSLLGYGGLGGNLVRGFIDAGYNDDSSNQTNMAKYELTVLPEI